MSVLASKRTESKFEAIIHSVELHDMLIELMQRNFGVKDIEKFVRSHFAYSAETDEYAKHRYLMHNFKSRVDHLASWLTNNVRAASSLYPISMAEYERRREYQNNAIVNCEQLIKELQRVVEVFDVDINLYSRYVKAIDREIDLIKKWRQRDNKIKSHLQGNI